jgi:membrane protein DedA with SNARE-associated domain
MVLAALADTVRDLVADGGYAALTLLILAENLFPPIPSELILPLGGYYVSTGELTYVGAVLASTLGSVAGAVILYELARRGGRPLLYRFRRTIRLTEEQLDRGDHWFDRRGPLIVFFGRLIPGVRSLVSVPAGLSEMPRGQFLALTTAGSALWNAALIGAGWGLGENYEDVEGIVGPASRVVLVLTVLGLVAGFVLLQRRRKRLRDAA